MFLINKVISFFTYKSSHHLFVDCDTHTSFFRMALRSVERHNEIYLHGYSVGEFDVPANIVRGEDIKTIHPIILSTTEHRIIYHSVRCREEGINAAHVISLTVLESMDENSDATYSVFTADREAVETLCLMSSIDPKITVYTC